MGEERDSGPEPTALCASAPPSLTFGTGLARRSQGFGTGLLPAPARECQEEEEEEENDSAKMKRNVFLKRARMRATKE